MGVITNCCTTANNFEVIFPGLKVRLCTLAANFKVPVFRDLLMALGIVSCSRNSVKNNLKNGISSIIVIGGAAETEHANPRVFKLVLKKRNGFIKLALETGASLVPSFGFGETDIWTQKIFPKDSTGGKIQTWIRNMFGVHIPILDRFMPRSSKIVTVFGSPIDCPMISAPSNEQIQIIKKQYIDGLVKLFEDHKRNYGYGDCVVEIVE
jgi:2-acylglycerol O-acyltransferase 2